MTALEALKATQYRIGQSGNAGRGGNTKKHRQWALDALLGLLKSGRVKPSDTVADLLNFLLETDSLLQCDPPGRRKASRKSGRSKLADPLDGVLGVLDGVIVEP